MIMCPVINPSTAQKMYMHIQWEMDTFKHRIFQITEVKIKTVITSQYAPLNFELRHPRWVRKEVKHN